MNSPAIRFAGFTEDWEQRKLYEISDKVTEKNVNRAYTETLTNSAEFGIISQRDFFDKNIANNDNIDGYYIVRHNDFVYNPRISTFAPVGPIKRNKLGRSGIMSPLYYVFRTHDIDQTYLEHFFATAGWHKFMAFNGDSGARSDRFSIKNSVFREMPLPYPSIAEQKKIGKQCDTLDRLIALHQCEHDKTVNIKKALLEKMFPKDSEDKPEIRFAGFTGAWEQRKLGKLVVISSASRVHKHEWKTSGVPFFRSSDVVSAFKGVDNEKAFISQNLFEELAKRSGKVQEGDVLITGGGSIGIPYKVPSNAPLYFKDADLLWLKQSGKIDGDFIYTFFTAPIFKAYVQSISHIGTIAHYTIEQVKETPILLPSIVEQAKIGAFFTNLDRLITLHQRELTKLQNIKKALLEKMFV
ncbi:restriction endonuclease subunit S [Desulfovibrio sp. QI0434]